MAKTGKNIISLLAGAGKGYFTARESARARRDQQARQEYEDSITQARLQLLQEQEGRQREEFELLKQLKSQPSINEGLDTEKFRQEKGHDSYQPSLNKPDINEGLATEQFRQKYGHDSYQPNVGGSGLGKEPINPKERIQKLILDVTGKADMFTRPGDTKQAISSGLEAMTKYGVLSPQDTLATQQAPPMNVFDPSVLQGKAKTEFEKLMQLINKGDKEAQELLQYLQTIGNQQAQQLLGK